MHLVEAVDALAATSGDKMKAQKTVGEWSKGRSDKELDDAESIERDLGKSLSEGLPEDIMVAFIEAAFIVREKVPDATTVGIFDQAFRMGLHLLLARLCQGCKGRAASSSKNVRGVRVVGVPGNKHGRS